MKYPKVYIVILNWNGLTDTIECIESLRRMRYPNFRILVVDNDSSDNDVELLKEAYKDYIQIFKCNDNLGYAGGNNAGIKISLEQNADFVLILNNDTTVEPDLLEELIKKYRTDNELGMVAPLINYYTDPHRIWSAGGRLSKIRGSGFAYSAMLETEIGKSAKVVTFISGCCMLVKKEVFQKVGLFDESFFLYIEDTDFCYRVLTEGYKLCFTPATKIYHKVKSTTGKNSSTLPLYYETRNRLYFAKKNFRGIHILTTLYIFITMILKSVIWLFQGKIENISTVQKSFEDYLKDNMGKREI